MRIACKNCKKNGNCFNPMRFKFGFCETLFEPIEEPPKSVLKGMAWKQIASNEWVAEGEMGKFRIERGNGKFWARYMSDDFAFNLRPKKTLTEAKQQCENNEYWEEAA